MFAHQSKISLSGMVDFLRNPRRSGMTTGAIFPQRALVEVFRFMAGIAVSGRPFKHSANMAGDTGHRGMFIG
jgi:hypothetical protein